MMRGTARARRLGGPIPPEDPPEEGRRRKNTRKPYEFKRRITQGTGWLYAMQFNTLDMGYSNTFACAGGRQVCIYQCLEGGDMVKLRSYTEEVQDGGDKDEEFFALTWAVGKEGMPLLVVAGKHGALRVIDCGTDRFSTTLIGHGGAINDLRTQNQNPFLIASASKDESVRLWNLHTRVCILILAGAHGHRHDVVSVDFHPHNRFLIASAGMDQTVKIWSLLDFWEYIELSKTWNRSPSEFPTKFIQFPILTVMAHGSYVDCARWLGDFILSKAPNEGILLWEPIYKSDEHPDGAFDALQEYPLEHCGIWFVKFSCDVTGAVLSCGNERGELMVWDLRTSPPVLLARLQHPQCKHPIRQTATSWDARTILCCCDDGSIWRWEQISDDELDSKRRRNKDFND